MKTRISIEGIETYSYHGCLKEETVIGGHFRVDVHIDMNANQAILADELSGTADYVIVNKVVREQMAIPSKLIEHVAGRIMMALNREIAGEKVIEVKVIKYNPPVNSQIGQASVTLTEEFK
jgi:dihydroneopterin aldolase